MKVLHIIGSGTIGGAEKFVYQLARYQKEYERDVNTGIYFVNLRGVFFDKAKMDGLVCANNEDNLGIKGFFKTVRCFKEYDILHFHGLYPALFLSAVLSGSKSIYLIHGARALTKDIKKVIKESIQTGSRHKLPSFEGFIRFIKRQWFKFFLKFIFKTIHAPSEYYIEFYIKNYRVPKRKISLLPLGIDLTELRPNKTINEVKKEFGIKDEKIIGCVSTFRVLKRIDRLIEGFAEFLKDNRNYKAKLLIVGDGVERKNLEDKIRKNKILSNVILTGLRKDIPNLLNVMDVFVLPSEFENFPISVVEAMYFSLPIIVFKGSGGAEEMAKRSGAGLLVNDEKELAEKMKYLLDNKDETERLGRIGHRFVVKKLTIGCFSENIKAVYKEVLNVK